MAKSVLITGVGGFIGAAVATRLRDKGWSVTGVDDLSNGYVSNVPREIEFHQLDLADAGALARIRRVYDAILHIAGQSSGEISFDNPVADINKNTVSLLNIIDLSKTCPPEKIIYASSMSVYGEVPDEPIREDHPTVPLSCYGVGKLASEQYLNVYSKDIDAVALRMFNVYGPGQDLANLRQGMVSIYIAQALKNKHIEIKGSLNRFRDFVFIDDVVTAWEAVISKKLEGFNVFNIASGRRTSVEELVRKIQSLISGVTTQEISGTLGDQPGIYADISAAEAVLDYKAKTDLDKGIETFISSVKEKFEFNRTG